MNCLNCMYYMDSSEKLLCTRHIYSEDKTIELNPDKIHLSCPCHSSIKHDENRYGFLGTKLNESDDVCVHCQRQINNNIYFKHFTIKQNGKKLKRKVCRICYDKYFHENGEAI